MVMPILILLIAAVLAVVSIAVVVLVTSIRVRTESRPIRVRHVAEILAGQWAPLRQKTIFFGHQSVGFDIVAGLRDLAARHAEVTLNLVETKDPGEVEGAMLAHERVGHNFDPQSKIAEFRRLLEGGLGEKVDIAFFKFCFVDLGRGSDPEAVLASYCETMAALKARFPQVVFLHVTVPLCGPPQRLKGMLKASIKRLIGRPPVLEENEVRARYNALLRERFAGKEPFFDLARYETLGPTGRPHYSIRQGRKVPVLVRAYTDDGGHLNQVGRVHLAEQLLLALHDSLGPQPGEDG